MGATENSIIMKTKFISNILQRCAAEPWHVGGARREESEKERVGGRRAMVSEKGVRGERWKEKGGEQ